MAVAYGYSPEEMRSVGSQLVSTRVEIGEKITAAQGLVGNLIGSGFTSAVASGAYKDQFDQLSTALVQVNDGLESLGTFLTQYADSVVNMDDQMGAALRG